VTLGRIGGGLIILGGAALAYTLAIGPDHIAPAVLLGIGAAVVSAAGPRPLDARLTRAGLGLLAVGGLSVALALAILNSDAEEMAELVPLLVALGAILLGCLAIGLSLLRSTGPVRAVGAVVLLGLLLVIVGNVVGGGQVTPPPILLAGYAVTGLGLTGVAVLALGIPRLQEGPSV
jgi:peptidoglycan/LPS O-acetylase OafA/YrhL